MKGDETMNNTKRNDAHRPSTINPAEYEHVCFLYQGQHDGMLNAIEMRFYNAHRAKTNGVAANINIGCDICGAHFAYGAVYHHALTNEYIHVGWICAEKMNFSRNGSAFRSWKKRLQSDRKLIAGQAKAQAELEAKGLGRAFEIFKMEESARTPENAWAFNTTRDIVGKFVRYGSISEKQENFLKSLVAKFDAPAEPKKEIKKGEFVGTVKTRENFDVTVAYITGYESAYGYVTVYILEDENGNSLVWKTSSGSLIVGESEFRGSVYARKGDKLTIKATVKAHAEYNGRNQTQLNRVSVEEVHSLTLDRGSVNGSVHHYRS